MSLSCSGGEASLVADLAAHLGIEMPEMGPGQAAALEAQLPGFVTATNPFDYNTWIWGDRAALERCFATVVGEGFDAAGLVLDFPRDGLDDTAFEITLEAFAAAAAASPALGIVISSFPELMPRGPRERAIATGLVPLQGLEEAMTAIRGAIWYRRRRSETTRESVVLPALRPLAGGPELLDEWRGKRLLGGHGLPVPAGRLLSPAQADSDGIATAAKDSGFPLVAKLVGAKLVHKTELGAVRLDLRSAADAAAAVTEMMAAAERQSVEVDGVLLEAMVGDAVAELIVGVKTRRALGPGPGARLGRTVGRTGRGQRAASAADRPDGGRARARPPAGGQAARRLSRRAGRRPGGGRRGDHGGCRLRRGPSRPAGRARRQPAPGPPGGRGCRGGRRSGPYRSGMTSGVRRW